MRAAATRGDFSVLARMFKAPALSYARPFTVMKDEASKFPPLQIGSFRYEPNGKNVLLALRTGDVIEFNSTDSAEAYLRSARNAAISGAEEAMLYYFQDDRWHRLQ